MKKINFVKFLPSRLFKKTILLINNKTDIVKNNILI